MRAYFLGAGASKAFFPSLPTGKCLTLEHLMDESSYGTNLYQVPEAEIKVLRDSPEKLRTQPIEYALDKLRQDAKMYQAILTCMCRRLSVSYDGYPGLLLSWLGSVRDNGDTILTTNYDTRLERGVGSLAQRSGNRNGVPLAHMEESGLIDYGLPVHPPYTGPNVPAVAETARLD
jgi:hypothetical protein